MENLRYNKLLRITIEDSGIFIKDELIEKIFDKELYRIFQYYDKNRAKIKITVDGSDEDSDEKSAVPTFNVYEFKETILGIYEMKIKNGFLQIDIKDMESEAYIDVIRKIFGDEKEKYWLKHLGKINCCLFEYHCALTYEDLVKANARHLPENLSDEEYHVTTVRNGHLDRCQYEITRELYKGQASFFDMKDCITFSNKVEAEHTRYNQSFEIDSVDDVIKRIQITRMVTKKLL